MEQKKKEIEYFKAPFGKRMISIIIEILLLAFTSFGFLFATRLIAEQSSSYQNSFQTFVEISKQSQLYVCDASTENNLVPLTEYYEKKTFEEQNSILEERLSSFYKMSLFFSEDPSSTDYGPNIFLNQKIGDNRIGKEDGIYYFISNDESEIKSNPSFSEEEMNKFYLSAYDKAISYLNNNDEYVLARNVVTIYINIIVIPVSIILAFFLLEVLFPLVFGRRGKQNIGMKIMKLSLLSANGLSLKAGRFFARQMIQLFLEILLSMVSFGIPLIVSFSMMLFRKDGESLHDYLVGAYMVDSADQSVYVSYSEMERLQKEADKMAKNTFSSSERSHEQQPLGDDSIWRDLKNK